MSDVLIKEMIDDVSHVLFSEYINQSSIISDDDVSHVLFNEYINHLTYKRITFVCVTRTNKEGWGSGVETQKNVRGEVGGWGRVPFNEPYAPSLSTIYDGA